MTMSLARRVKAVEKRVNRPGRCDACDGVGDCAWVMVSADGERGVTRGACRRCGRVESVKEYAGGGRAGDEWPEWFVSV